MEITRKKTIKQSCGSIHIEAEKINPNSDWSLQVIDVRTDGAMVFDQVHINSLVAVLKEMGLVR